MKQALLNSLTETGTRLVAETEPDALTDLDEDACSSSRPDPPGPDQVREALSPAGQRRVAADGGRGFSYAKNQRDRDKAEVFELALARVSSRVEVVAKQAAAELRAERLAAARAGRGTGPGLRPGPATDADAGRRATPPAGQDHGRDEEGRLDARHGSPPSGRARQPIGRRRDRPRCSPARADRRFAGRALAMDEEVYASASATNHRTLRRPDRGRGTAERVVDADSCRYTLAVMAHRGATSTSARPKQTIQVTSAAGRWWRAHRLPAADGRDLAGASDL